MLAFPNSTGEIKKVVTGTVMKEIIAPITGPSEKPINFFMNLSNRLHHIIQQHFPLQRDKF